MMDPIIVHRLWHGPRRAIGRASKGKAETEARDLQFRTGMGMVQSYRLVADSAVVALP